MDKTWFCEECNSLNGSVRDCCWKCGVNKKDTGIEVTQETEQSLMSKIKLAWIFGYISVGITFIVMLVFKDPIYIIDVIFGGACATLLCAKQSRAAATALIIYFAISKIFQAPSLIENGNLFDMVVAGVWLWVFYRGTKATYVLHKIRSGKMAIQVPPENIEIV